MVPVVQCRDSELPLSVIDKNICSAEKQKIKNVFELLTPLTLPYQDIEGRTLQLWKYKNEFVGSIRKRYEIHFISSNRIRNPLQIPGSSTAFLNHIENMGLRKWSLVMEKKSITLPIITKHLQECDNSIRNFLYFKNEPDFQNNNSIKTVKIREINSKNELFKAFSSQLDFPCYFGNNYDALYDSMCELDNIMEKTIAIIHETMPFGNDLSNKKTYLNLLLDLVNDYNISDSHAFNIYFPEKYKLEIESLLNERD